MRVLLLLLDEDDYRSSRRALARALVARGDEVFVMAARDPARGDRVELDPGVRAIGWSIDRGSLDPRREARAVAEVLATYARLRPDLVHHVSHKPAVYGGLAAMLVGVPTVTTVTGLGYLATSGVAADRRPATIDRLVFGGLLAALRVVHRRRDTRVIFQNRDDLATLVEAGVVERSRARLVRGSGVDIARFAPDSAPARGDGPPIVMFAGRLLREKGVVELCQAAAQVRARGVAARFVLVGDVDPHNPGSLSRAEIARWTADGTVEAWGHRDDMPALLAGATVVCVPSWGEGLPKVLLEAAACARAIVTTDAPGCREVVRDGVEGLVVAPRDPAALAAAIARLLGDPALRRTLGDRARARVAGELTDAHVVAHTLAVYDELVEARRANRRPTRRLLFAGNAMARRLVYRSPRATMLIWGARVAGEAAHSFWELGSLAMRETLRRELRDGMRVLEIGTGPYAIVAVWAARRWRLELIATDIDPSAAASAARTAAANDARIDVRCCDLFDGIAGRFDAIWFVPPFTPVATFAAQGGALDDPGARWRTCGGDRGWETIDRFLAGARDRLAPAGRAYFVVNTVHQPASEMRALVERRGLGVVRSDRLPLLPYVTFAVTA